MNRSDLITSLRNRKSISRNAAEKIIDLFFGTITDTMAGGNRVEIRGFGSFTVKHYKSYVGRNPKSGDRISVPPKKLPFFKVGKELRELVDSQF